jgi:aldehyde dehydrogenase (NAD+)
MRAAAEHLTPVTLELGGKSPAIVDRTADLREAAKKIAWGKALNCGQICVAPDYVLVDETVREPFLAELRDALHADTSGLLVNDRHAQRVKRLLDDATDRGATVIGGGTGTGRAIAPTLLAGVSPDAAIMREEIFGPLLPVMTYKSREEAMRIVGEGEKPLVLYIFSRDKSVVDELLRGTRAGGTVINDTLIHFFQVNLPFGGVGASGMGKAHGFFGFETFSNARGVLEQPMRRSGTLLIHPPYTWLKKRVIDFMVRWL